MKKIILALSMVLILMGSNQLFADYCTISGITNPLDANGTYNFLDNGGNNGSARYKHISAEYYIYRSSTITWVISPSLTYSSSTELFYKYDLARPPVPPENGYTAANGGAGSPQVLHNDSSLPVGLFSFSARETAQGIQLTWITESEVDNQGFVLERFEETSGWIQIASYQTNEALKGPGNTSSRTESV